MAVSPLHRAVESRYLPKDLSQALDQVARVTPLWDFTGADWLSDDPNYWMGDTAHYSQEVGRMMLARILYVNVHPSCATATDTEASVRVAAMAPAKMLFFIPIPPSPPI